MGRRGAQRGAHSRAVGSRKDPGVRGGKLSAISAPEPAHHLAHTEKGHQAGWSGDLEVGDNPRETRMDSEQRPSKAQADGPPQSSEPPGDLGLTRTSWEETCHPFPQPRAAVPYPGMEAPDPTLPPGAPWVRSEPKQEDA